MGRMTTQRMLSSMPTTSTSTVSPASSHTSRGVRIGASKVDVAVIPTDSAKSPLDRYVMTFEAVPPGQHPTRITPMASAGSSLNIRVNASASSGITVNCARQPTSTSLGRLKTTRKSAALSVRPMPNMMTPSSGLMSRGFRWPSASGNVSAATAASSTSTPMWSDMNWQMRFIETQRYRFSGDKKI